MFPNVLLAAVPIAVIATKQATTMPQHDRIFNGCRAIFRFQELDEFLKRISHGLYFLFGALSYQLPSPIQVMLPS
jgi:hypothetical protein